MKETMDLGLSVHFRTSIPLSLDGDPDQFLVRYAGRIVEPADEAGERRARVVGRIHATRLHVAAAVGHGVEVFDVCDADSQVMTDLYAALFDHHTGQVSAAIAEGGAGLDVLFVDSVELLPRLRGRGLALQAVRRTMEFLGEGCAVTALEAHPLDYGQVRDEKWVRRMHPERFEQGRAAALRKLRRYWSRLGFRRVGGTRFMVFDMGYAFPEVPAEPPKRLLH